MGNIASSSVGADARIRPRVDASIDPYKGDTHNYNFFLLLDWLSGLS